MKNLTRLALISTTALFLGTTTMMADVTQPVIDQLAAEGYTHIKIRRGLTRVTLEATAPGREKEVVVAKSSGRVVSSEERDRDDTKDHRAESSSSRDDRDDDRGDDHASTDHGTDDRNEDHGDSHDNDRSNDHDNDRSSDHKSDDRGKDDHDDDKDRD